ncbi:flagellar biosynthetic protein FliO [Buchnera aphidicola]|uniref:flagellar biosynthetic protein FliO n=1 Tax=Buchnera aphidicola TaxID=9 RepID=UPI0020924730|nr:flagellar biosynthetic protein FliO [Buchnera aphidicola]USS94648.1 flagellar biosynthetic protein FliO [Buchnera aphidicola (Periphyllus lyropictus)]
MNNYFLSIYNYFSLNNIKNNNFFYIFFILLLIFIIIKIFFLYNKKNSSDLKIKSIIFVDSNTKIIILNVNKVKLVLGITSEKIVKLHTFTTKKKKNLNNKKNKIKYSIK